MRYTNKSKDEVIEDILSDSAYLPETSAYKQAAIGLQKLTLAEVNALYVIVLCKR